MNGAHGANRGRKSCSIVTRSPPQRLDPPRDVHPVRRAALVDEPDPARLGLAPGPRSPRHRQAEAEQPEQRPSGDQPGDHAAVGPPVEDADVLVVGEQPRPALHVPGEGEHDLRRGRDVDRDGALHGSAPGHTSPIACRATDTSFSWATSSRPNQPQRSVDPSTSSVSRPPVTSTRYRTPRKWRSAPLAYGDRGTGARTRLRPPRSAPSARSPRAARGPRRRPDAPRSRRHRRGASTPRAPGSLEASRHSRMRSSRSRQIA